MKDNILAEAKRLYDLGFAIHWLHPKSKRPIESKWTTGPRKDWNYLRETYQKGMNVGVRLGTPSKYKGYFLAVIDVDVKSTDPKHRKEVDQALRGALKDSILPEVLSGRGNGSRHYYALTKEPVKPFKALTSKERIKVSMPSVKPSKKDLEALTAQEIEQGIRMRPAWEIGVMGDGQQVVLPPSLHPDSGKQYAWKKPFDGLSAFVFEALPFTKPDSEEGSGESKTKIDEPEVNQEFVIEKVDVAWLPISEKIRKMILTGEGVEDRSASLLPVAQALLRAGLTNNEILSVLTDPDTFLGPCAYEHAQTKNRKRAMYWVYKYTLRKVLSEHSAEAIFSEPITEPKPLTFDQVTNIEALDEEIRNWKLSLEITKDDKYKTNLYNTVTILENMTPNLFKRDLFSIRDFYSYDAPWGGKKDKAIGDDDVKQIKLWLSRNFGIEPSSNTIGDALSILAIEGSFDPVKDALKALPAWDEKPRLDTWLKKHFGAKGHDDYLAQVFRKWMVAMVMRIEKPGAKFDWMPIFEGAQGVGKSSFGRILVGDKYFLDWLPDLGNKDSALALQGVWAVEMGELASFRKNEIETVKAFITRTIDKVRPPYGERWLESPRRCVFFGTTNYETYLRDDSGNRRFKPVKVGRLDFAALAEEREQLFAEALYLYRHGFESETTLDIDGEARLYERQLQAEKMVADESVLMQESLSIFIENELKKPDEEKFNFTKFRLQDLFDKSGSVFGGIGPLGNWKFDSRHAQFASKALKNLNGEKSKIRGNIYWKLPIS